MNTAKPFQAIINADFEEVYGGNGNNLVEFSKETDAMELETLDDVEEEGNISAASLLRTLPNDVTLIVQNTSYTLEVLESYKHIISDEMRTILQQEGHRSSNFRRHGDVLRNITSAIRLKTDFVRDLFHRLSKLPPRDIAKTSYATVIHYQKSLLDYQQILTQKQAQLDQEQNTLKTILVKLDNTFILLRNRAKEISELLSSVVLEEIVSYPPQELEEFRTILESSLDENVGESEQYQRNCRHTLIKVLEGIAIQTLSFKENRKYQKILNDIEWYLGQEKATFVADIILRVAVLSPREIARKYEATIIKHNLLLLSHFILLLDSQDNVPLFEKYNETSKRLSEALNIKLNPYKEQLGLKICDELSGIHPDELAAYQPIERIREYRKILEASISAAEENEQHADMLLRKKTLVKLLEAEGIQILMWKDPDKHKKYQEILGQIEQNIQPFKEEFIKERLDRFFGLNVLEISQKYRVNTIKHNVLLLARLALLLNMQENVDVMFQYYTVSKNIFEALNLKLEEGKKRKRETDTKRTDAKKVLLESDLFRTLSSSAIERIVDRFAPTICPKGTVIIEKGQKGDAFYVIGTGSVRVGVPTKGGKEIQLAQLGYSDCFGEMSLLTGNPASASITSLEDVELLKLSEEHFNDILLEYPVLNRYFHRILSERLRSASDKTRPGELNKGLAGKLSTISLEELIQTLYTANKTGVLTIDNHGDKGKIYIKNGLVIHAMTKNLKGEQAFFHVMTWNDASFRFVPDDVNVERSVTMNVHGLLLEGMKRIDDMRQIKNL